MQPLIKGSSRLIRVLLALLFILLTTVVWAQVEQERGQVELTKADLFSLKNWQRSSVTVDGFMLGMTRTRALATAQARNLELEGRPMAITDPAVGPCEGSSCSVGQVRGNWVGINLDFDSKDRVTAIEVSYPDGADPEVRKVSVVHKFKGLTYAFFNHYSDSLRIRILGSVENTKRPRSNIPGDAEVVIDYPYPHLGLVVHVTIDKRDHPPKPYDLEVDFVTPTKEISGIGRRETENIEEASDVTMGKRDPKAESAKIMKWQ